MEYINVLSMILDSDRNTTHEYASIFDNVKPDSFIDSDMLSDTPLIRPSHDGRYICLRKLDNIIVLDYLTNGTGSIKSCTKKIQIEFVNNLGSKLLTLSPDKLTTYMDDINHQQLCMVATVFNMSYKNSMPEQILQRREYTVCYYLRKNRAQHHYLQSEIRLANPAVYKNYQLHEHSLFFDIKPVYQNAIAEAKHNAFVQELKENQKYDVEMEDDDYSDADDNYDQDDDYNNNPNLSF